MNAERVYGILLRAYPPEFRAEYGREMMLVFRDQCREGDVRSLGFWARVVWDVVRSAPALRAEATRTVEVSMKLAAILALLVGILGIVNAVTEWMAGGMGTTQHALALVLGIGASVLLLVAGAAILGPSSRRLQTGRLALIASLVMIVAARLLHPWMSVFGQLLGIGVPVVLVIALYWPRKAAPSGAV